LWADINNTGTVYEANRVDGNDGPGIFHEVSYDAVIRGNTVGNNGHKFLGWIDGAGILISCSPDVTVTGNVLVGNRCGIAGKQVYREDAATASHGPWQLKNLRVHDNQIIRSGRSGLARNTADPILSEWGNRFYSNSYYEDAGFWGEQGPMTKAEWQAAGQDGDSVWIPAWPVPVEPPPSVVRPAKPVIFGVERSILWNPVPDADWYRVQVMTDEGWLTFADTVQHEITVGARGRYRLRAVNEAGVGPWQSVLV
jgi:parallel beta-helix repeat protein